MTIPAEELGSHRHAWGQAGRQLLLGPLRGDSIREEAHACLNN
jgi:hypothetical protein